MRYMQRVHNIDIEKYREEMHSDELEAMVATGAEAVKIEGFTFVCKGGRIVTTWEGRNIKGKGIKKRKRRQNEKRSPGGSHRSKLMSKSGFKD